MSKQKREEKKKKPNLMIKVDMRDEIGIKGEEHIRGRGIRERGKGGRNKGRRGRMVDGENINEEGRMQSEEEERIKFKNREVEG